jgi:hypothetical protein
MHDEEGQENLSLILELQNRITTKRSKMLKRTKKLQEIERRQHTIENQINKKRKEVEHLQSIAIDLKNEFTDWRAFVRNCH